MEHETKHEATNIYMNGDLKERLQEIKEKNKMGPERSFSYITNEIIRIGLEAFKKESK